MNPEMRAFFTANLVTLFGTLLLTGRGSSLSYAALQNCYGQPLCATDAPDNVTTLIRPPSPTCIPSSVICGWKCENMTGCLHYNYRASTQMCELYTSDPFCFQSVPDCNFFKNKNSAFPTSCLTTGSQYKSCKEIQGFNSSATSGLYCVTMSSKKTVQVYCDMVLEGGGYTFLVGSTLANGTLTEPDLLDMLTDRTSVLFISKHSDQTQKYGTISQLSQYSPTPLKIGLNEHDLYSAPGNADINYLGLRYLYIGFVKISAIVSSVTTNGLSINNFDNAFTNCDGNPSSYMAFFPYGPNHVGSFDCCSNAFTTNLFNRLKPINVLLPPRYFLFMEMGFGGCGCAIQTTGTNYMNGIIGANIGFK